MYLLQLRLIAMIAMVLLFTLPVFAGGEIGLTYNRDAVGDQDIGFIGEFEHDAGFGEFEVESQAQIGDLITRQT